MIATGGTGVLPQGALHPDLVTRLSGECVRTAQSVLTMCIRAFDYLSPADVTFGAFLRALVTADWELNPLDEFGVRTALIEACRRRGIFAAEAGSLAVNALLLDVARRDEWRAHEPVFRGWVDLAIQGDIEQQRASIPEDGAEDVFVDTTPMNWSPMQQAPPVRAEVYETEEELPIAAQLSTKITGWFLGLTDDQREILGFLRTPDLKRPQFHSSRRVTSDGTLRFGLVVQLMQRQVVSVSGVAREFGARGAQCRRTGRGRIHAVECEVECPSNRQPPEWVQARGRPAGKTTVSTGPKGQVSIAIQDPCLTGCDHPRARAADGSEVSEELESTQ
jgi:hypothetical protein